MQYSIPELTVKGSPCPGIAIRLTSVTLSSANRPVPVRVLSMAGAPIKSVAAGRVASLPPARFTGVAIGAGEAVKSLVIAMYSERLLIAVTA